MTDSREVPKKQTPILVQFVMKKNKEATKITNHENLPCTEQDKCELFSDSDDSNEDVVMLNADPGKEDSCPLLKSQS